MFVKYRLHQPVFAAKVVLDGIAVTLPRGAGDGVERDTFDTVTCKQLLGCGDQGLTRALAAAVRSVANNWAPGFLFQCIGFWQAVIIPAPKSRRPLAMSGR